MELILSMVVHKGSCRTKLLEGNHIPRWSMVGGASIVVAATRGTHMRATTSKTHCRAYVCARFCTFLAILIEVCYWCRTILPFGTWATGGLHCGLVVSLIFPWGHFTKKYIVSCEFHSVPGNVCLVPDYFYLVPGFFYLVPENLDFESTFGL